MARRCKTAFVDPPVAENDATAFSSAARVHDGPRAGAVLDELDGEAARCFRNCGLVGMCRRHRVGTGRRDAEELERVAHRVGGVLTAARPRAGTCVLFHGPELGRVDLSRVVCADSLEHILDSEIAVMQPAWLDGAPVEDEAGKIHPAERHRGRRNRLVTADDEDEAVEAVTARHELDRVGDDLARHERRLHSLGSHGHAVADRDGVELHRRAARSTNSGFHPFGERPMIPVARHGLDPGMADADDRALEILAAESDRAKHRACGRAVRSVQHHCAAPRRIRVSHSRKHTARPSQLRVLTRRTARPYPSPHYVARARPGSAGWPAPD